MKAKVTFEVDDCLKCPFHEKHQIVTPDPYEHEIGIYCSQTDYSGTEWSQETMDGLIKKRMIGCDDWYPEKYTDVPGWCPFIIKQYLTFMSELCEDEQWKRYMNANTSNPWRQTDLAFDYGIDHAIHTINLAEEFLDNLAENSFKEFYYGEECHSIARDKYLMSIASLLRDVGSHEPLNENGNGRLDRQNFLEESELSEEDKDIITDAMMHWENIEDLIQSFDGKKELAKVHGSRPVLDTPTAIKVALALASVLDVGPSRVTRSTYEVHSTGATYGVDVGIRSLALAFKKIEKVEFKFTYNEHHGKISEPSPKNGAELHYTTTSGFDANALKFWPELILTPRVIARDFLGLRSFKFMLNGREINVRRLFET